MSDYTYTLLNDEATITGYTGPGGELMIPETLDSYPVKHIGAFALAFKTTIISVSIPNCVVSIGDGAFAECTRMTSFSTGDGVVTIGNFALHGASSLSLMVLGTGVASIGYLAFDGINPLATVELHMLAQPEIIGG